MSLNWPVAELGRIHLLRNSGEFRCGLQVLPNGCEFGYDHLYGALAPTCLDYDLHLWADFHRVSITLSVGICLGPRVV
jgi:hypothetical protein